MNSERCNQCKHFIIANAGEGKIYGCDRSKCVFEPIIKNSPEIDMAIKIIKADSLAPYSVNDILSARDLAVEALKQMTTTKNDLGVDCISRDSALKALDYDIKSFKFKSGIGEHMDDIAILLDTIYEIQENNIKDLPSVTPQPRKGHWIKGYTFPDGEYWKCDKCNELIKVKYPMHYCNNCGADMREVENDTD